MSAAEEIRFGWGFEPSGNGFSWYVESSLGRESGHSPSEGEAVAELRGARDRLYPTDLAFEAAMQRAKRHIQSAEVALLQARLAARSQHRHPIHSAIDSALEQTGAALVMASGDAADE